jgi:hypothetical protein
MTEINSLLNEYKVLTQLVRDPAVIARNAHRPAMANANDRIATITRKLWNLGISPAQIERLVKA